jgi:hypothetical protein
MKKTTLALVAALAVACGGSSNGSNNNNNGNVSSLKGTIGGASFTPADGMAFVIAPTTCTFSGVTESVSAVAVSFSSFPGMCQFANEHLCDDKKDVTGVSAAITRFGPSASLATIGPGTYKLSTQTAPDENGVFTLVVASASKNNEHCDDTMSGVTASAGTITIDAISPKVKGSLTLTFSDGSTFSGSFDAPNCLGASFDFCDPTAPGTCSQHTAACL